MLGSVGLAFLTLGLLVPANLRAQTEAHRLISVQVQGSQKLPAEEVAALSGLSIGETVTLQDLKSAADRLAQLQLFDYVTYKYETAPDTIAVTFIVEDAAQLRPVRFDNFVWLSENELLARLEGEIPVFRGVAPPGGYLIEEIKQVLEEILVEQGIQARVQHFPSILPDGNDVNLFRVEEVTVPIASIAFQGSDEKILRKAGQVLEGRDYSKNFLAGYIQQTILPLYHARGYLQVDFGEPQVEYLGEAENTHPVKITIPVKEGKAYRVGAIHWRGNEVLPTEVLADKVELEPGDVADIVQLREDLEEIREQQYGRQGYIRAELDIQSSVDEEAASVELEIDVKENELYRFQELEIHGLADQAAEWLRRRWKLSPGQPFDTTYVGEFMRKDVSKLRSQLKPQPHTVDFSLHRNDDEKTVILVFRFR